MSTDSRPLENSRPQAEADSYSMVSRSSEMARVESGQMRSFTSAATWSSYWKRGTASSGCCSRKARAMRPDFCASNSGSRPPWIRLWTKAEMNTVLPARDRPVTPSRSDGDDQARRALAQRVERDQRLVGEGGERRQSVSLSDCGPPI